MAAPVLHLNLLRGQHYLKHQLRSLLVLHRVPAAVDLGSLKNEA